MIDAQSVAIGLFFGEKKQFIAPVYQRNYAWLAHKQCQTLWNDLIKLASSKDSKSHFLGSVVIIKLDDGFSRSFIVDGQQRLTTVQLLTIALLKYFQERLHTDELKGEANSDWVKGISFYENNKGRAIITGYSDVKCKLVLNGVDDSTFYKLANDYAQDSFTSQEMNTNVFLNYQFFLSHLHQANFELGDLKGDAEGLSFLQWKKIWNALMKGLMVARIVLEGNDNPQRVFESLNSTGLELQSSDLIRNYVLMSTDGNERAQKTLFEQYWQPLEQQFPVNDSTPMTHFFLTLLDVKQLTECRTEFRKQNELYITFKEFYRNDEGNGALDYAPQLLQYAKCYAKMRGWAKEKEQDPELAAIFKDIDWLKGSARNPAYTVILYLYYCLQDGRKGWSKADFVQVCRQIVSYLVRRIVCSCDSHDLELMRSIMMSNLGDELKPLNEQVQANFSALIENGTFPSDNDFEYALKHADIYNLNTSLRIGRFLLTRLAEIDPVIADDSKLMSIEHILPQNENLNESWQKELGADWASVQQLWLHRFGNLTLTFTNSELGDKPFSEKLLEYRRSNISFLNEEVVNQEHWTPLQIEHRGEVLAARCLELWPMPEVMSSGTEVKKPKRRKVKTLSDYCGTSQSLLNCFTEVDQMMKDYLGDVAGFRSVARANFVEYSINSKVIAIAKPYEALGKVKLWLRCSVDTLPSNVNRDFVTASHDWNSWNGVEVCLAFDACLDKSMRESYYLHLFYVVNATKQQLRSGAF